MKFFLIVLESTWLLGTLRIKRSFRLAGNLPTVGMIGGVMTGAIVPWAGRNILHRGLNHLPSLARENRLLREDRQMFWTSGRGIDPRVE